MSLGVPVGQTYVPTIIANSASGPNSVSSLAIVPNTRGVKCLDVATGRIYISRDVVFDETKFPFETLHPNAGALLRQEILLLPTTLSSVDQGGENNSTDQPLTTHHVLPEFIAADSSSGANLGPNGRHFMCPQ